MFLFLFFLSLCHVIYIDLTKRKIFNSSVIIFFVFGCLFLILDIGAEYSQGWKYSIIAFLAVFIVFFTFYKIGWMGAGDVKYGAALAFCLGLKMFFWVWVISVVLAIFYSLGLKFLMPFIYQKGWVGVSGIEKKKNVPYGAMLSIATIFLIMRLQ